MENAEKGHSHIHKPIKHKTSKDDIEGNDTHGYTTEEERRKTSRNGAKCRRAQQIEARE